MPNLTCHESTLPPGCYSPVAILHAVSPRNRGRVPFPDGIGHASDPSQPDWLEISLRLDPDAARIAEARFRAAGSPALTAAASVLVERCHGCTLRTCRAIDVDTLLAALGGLPKLRRYTAALAIQALRRALAAAVLKPCRRTA